MHTFLFSQFERLNLLYWLINDLTSISKPLANAYEITRRNSDYGLLVLTSLFLLVHTDNWKTSEDEILHLSETSVYCNKTTL
jgi:hypothetical protein